MTYEHLKPSRQARKAQVRRLAKTYVARMKVRLNDGGRSTINSAKAMKVIERGTASLIVNNGRPFVMQISHGEAAAFFGDEVDLTGRYAMAFAVDKNGNPYSTLPVCAFPRANNAGPAPTADELVEWAEQSAYRALFNEHLGFWPHMPQMAGQGPRQ